jgi:adenylyl cyclase-associated protein
MTHKNPLLRQSNIVKAEKTAGVAMSDDRPVAPQKKPAIFALEGNKWIVENHIGNRNILIEKVELRHSAYIFNCVDCVIHIKGKLNQITIGRQFEKRHVLDSVVHVHIMCRFLQKDRLGR